LRLSVRAFAEHLDVAVRTVTKWESLGSATTPRPDTQALLDTALELAGPEARRRFELLLADEQGASHSGQATPRDWDYETWTDDLSRAAVCLARQDFAFGTNLVERWLRRYSPTRLDQHGQYLYARSLALLGDIRRDQGAIHGPLSARHRYTSARSLFSSLGMPRRVAQLDLSLTVVDEMADALEPASTRYRTLAGDDRLDGRDQARARLWLGTALSKGGHHTAATDAMRAAIQAFETLEEPDDWSVAHQKLALAHRGAGDLTKALRSIDVALRHRPTDSPMQRVRLDTAHAHILLSDPATAEHGLSLLDRSARTSTDFNLSHQHASIGRIRRWYEHNRHNRPREII
jgi:tetratricopeptide (TPR) repeat protein